jgi:hypothetical protein
MFESQPGIYNFISRLPGEEFCYRFIAETLKLLLKNTSFTDG